VQWGEVLQLAERRHRRIVDERGPGELGTAVHDAMCHRVELAEFGPARAQLREQRVDGSRDIRSSGEPMFSMRRSSACGGRSPAITAHLIEELPQLMARMRMGLMMARVGAGMSSVRDAHGQCASGSRR
jgi:hypothetical protein